MKNLFKLLLITSVGLSFVLTSCKYEEGPGISFRTKKARVEGTWTVEESFTNGEKDSFSDKRTFIFSKEGDISIQSIILGLTASQDGKWKFTNSKETLQMVFPGIDFPGSTSFEIIEDHEILKLKNKEMWLERTTANGDKRELHLIQE